MARCVACNDDIAVIGVVCQQCVSLLSAADGICPEQIVSAGAHTPTGWLIDRWGRAPPRARERRCLGTRARIRLRAVR